MLTNSLWGDMQHYLRYGSVVVKLVLVNVVVYLLGNIAWLIFSVIHNDAAYALMNSYLCLPVSFAGVLHQPWSLITYMFYHNGFFHILFNMIMLYWGGEMFVLHLGEQKVVALYIYGGFCGALFFLLGHAFLPSLQLLPFPLIGASAAALAFLFAAVAMNPNYEIYIFRSGPFKLKYIAGILFVVYLLSAFYFKSGQGSNLAHIGGALGGFLYIKLLQQGYDIFKPLAIFNRNPPVKMSYKNPGNASVKERGQSEQARVDEILDKIARSGYESLSKDDKDFLFRYSKK
ncbi:MAG TPA: rhomboid family intramembrane serine protease [Chitinophagales bacterium]|nr:rhomboid family intramembrane serine protease [Chitinophagales bacterium]